MLANAIREAAGLEERLRAIDGLRVETDVPLADRTRFAVGGPADLFASAARPEALAAAVQVCGAAGAPYTLLGDGTNVVASDAGFRGLVLRYVSDRLECRGSNISVAAGAKLQALVDLSLEQGLEGLHALTRIPGSVGGAVYGNAGAYGHQIDEFVKSVEFFDGASVRSLGCRACEFKYRESVFKRRKDWLILSARLALEPGDASALRARAAEIRALRDEKFPPSLRCAGSIFKNLYLASLPAAAAAEVPARAVRAGKVASAYFLERVGAKGMRNGGIEIASYHANLLYNRGGGTAAEIRALVLELKARVRERFGFEVEEEVQYIG